MQEILIPRKDKLQSILQHRVGFGQGQSKLLRSLYLLLFSQGSESIVLGLLIPQLALDWEITTFDKSLLITLVYIGVSLGSYIQTYSDNFGRYRFLIIDAFITSFFGVVSAFSINFQFFLITRFFYGIGIGIALPLTATYITQIVPSSHRAYIMSLSRVYWSLGCLFACVVGWLLMTSNHWRVTLIILSLPNIFALYDILANGKQSLRYLWAKGYAERSKVVLDKLTEGNKQEHVSYKEIVEGIQEYQQLKKHQETHNFKLQFHQLFNTKYRKQTFILCFSWATCCFDYYVLVLILPSILSRHADFSSNFQYLFIIIISLFEVISFMVSKTVMDSPLLGRKKSLIYGLSIVTISSLIVIMVGESHYTFLLLIFIVIKIFSSMSFMILYPYSAEIYETKIRGLAMGIFSLCGRIATALIGVIGISALQWFGGYGLYLIMVCISGISAFALRYMPYCTLGRQLDT